MPLSAGATGGSSGAVKLRWIFGWTLVRISGHSMEPALRNGDYAILKRLKSPGNLDAGDIVLVNHPRFGLIIKAVRARDGAASVFLEGASAASTPRDELGSVGSQCVLATLVWRIAQPILNSR